jgi:hypothetical protein
MLTATGFAFEQLPDGNVLIEFFGDDGKTINKPVVTPEIIRQVPLVAALLDVAVKMGPEAALEIVERLNKLRTKREIHNEGNN